MDEEGRVVKFKGRLTNKAINTLNVYYGGAIRNSGGSVDAMVKAIDASFLHSMSTDHIKYPVHNPSDKISWCKYKIAQNQNESLIIISGFMLARSSTTVQLAVNIAILVYNKGKEMTCLEHWGWKVHSVLPNSINNMTDFGSTKVKRGQKHTLHFSEN